MVNSFQAKMREYSSLKALQILMALNKFENESSISEIARYTDLSESTIHRILQELLECNFVEKDTKQKLYRIGFQTKQFAISVKTMDILIDASYEEIEHLNNVTKETINLIVPDGYSGVYLAKAEAQNQIRLRSKVGWKLPLYCSSGGKLILAYQTEEWLEAYFAAVNLEKLTHNTITDATMIRKELAEVRAQGYALDNREHNDDIICIAAPIFNAEGKILGTISISAPEYRFSLEKALSYKTVLMESVATISAKFGYAGN